MMTWTLRRQPTFAGATLGELDLGAGRQCYTLEDAIREMPGVPVDVWKVAGHTAIPAGRYRLAITPSARFKRLLPVLVDVPGFSGIRIHPGNTAADTEGCILLGKTRLGAVRIGESRAAFDEVFRRLQRALKVMDVYLDIVNPTGTLDA